MPITEEKEPCFTGTCDGCGDPLGDPDLWSFAHCESADKVREYARDLEWTVEGDELFCEQCASKLTCERRGHDLTKEPDGGYVCERCEEMWDHHPGADLTVVES